ncbi:cellulase [Catenovulum agarivorans DS-2]|uniref:Endoglucanase n=1 Tax=Catenovulum agarivorans DS-2 TaxID=1328313 RepID=W7QS64_9ALTE|nr:glycoside hydrolase family 9 protein [Catenovulum agarivorans]EWH08250.1 cellulase [Catenovulum agarivorans DS-2]
MNCYQRNILSVLLVHFCIACSSSKSDTNVTDPQTKSPTDPQTSIQTTELIKVNQLGYRIADKKVAIVPNVEATSFELINADTNEVVYQGNLSTSKSWLPAGSTLFKRADFSSFQQTGKFKISIGGVKESYVFEVADNVYDELHDAALKAYYYNRAGQEITEPYAQGFSRQLGHADTQVTVHSSAATQSRPAGSKLHSTKGWYDAGDYGKYIVNSGISSYTLLLAYQQHPEFYTNRDLNIPESADGIPDILNEIKWNLDWMATMQDQDGSVYHKLTSLGWPGKEMPVQDQRERFVIGKSTSAALNFAAVMAFASQVYQPFDTTGYTQQWLVAAENAWNWAKNNDNLPYQQPADVQSGEYGDSYFNDEFSWAAAQLYLATEKPEYKAAYFAYQQSFSTPSWQYVASLPAVSLLTFGKSLLTAAEYQQIQQNYLALANILLQHYQQSSYSVAMTSADFVWGSNAVVLNQAMILLQAFKLTEQLNYKHAATGALSYVLGKNPTDYSFVTGYGANPVKHIHHRISESDGIESPIPALLAGGAQNGKQDGCNYVSSQPATTFLDDWCSYSTNEVAINWNAPLVYVLSALLAE